MKTGPECLPCFFRQMRFALNSAGVNGDLGRAIMRKGEAIVEYASFDQPPARITTLLHRMVREETGRAGTRIHSSRTPITVLRSISFHSSGRWLPGWRTRWRPG